MRYRASMVRAGWALALGGASIGTGVALVGWGGGIGAPVTLAGLWLVGAVLGAVAIAGLGGPVWWLTQQIGRRRGRRGPIAAGLTGAVVSGLAAIAVLTQGFGLGLPIADAATLTAIWTSATVMALIAGFLGGLIALAMWLVSYRPTGR